jgi:hypothetical protein
MMNEAKKTMDAAKSKAAINAAFGELHNEVELAVLVASVRRIHYDASIKAGFTPEQAITLCMKRTL